MRPLTLKQEPENFFYFLSPYKYGLFYLLPYSITTKEFQMYAENDLDIRNRDNVRNNGEVFTPTPIVDSMNDLVPKSAWEDKEFVFLEPTCGNGQFLTRIFEKRIANGLSIEEALKILHPSAMNIASREREYMGFSLSVVAKKSYSYEDPVIAELEEKIKKRKELARQALSLGIETIIVQETGEIVPAAIVTGSSEYIKRGNAIPLESENPTINHKKKKGSI